MTDAEAIAEYLHQAGLQLSLTDDLRLYVTPASAITPTVRKVIGTHKTALVDWLLSLTPHEPFTEPPGYEGTGWLVAGADGLSPQTLAKFRAASLALDVLIKNQINQPGSHTQISQ